MFAGWGIKTSSIASQYTLFNIEGSGPEQRRNRCQIVSRAMKCVGLTGYEEQVPELKVSSALPVTTSCNPHTCTTCGLVCKSLVGLNVTPVMNNWNELCVGHSNIEIEILLLYCLKYISVCGGGWQQQLSQWFLDVWVLHILEIPNCPHMIWL